MRLDEYVRRQWRLFGPGYGEMRPLAAIIAKRAGSGRALKRATAPGASLQGYRTPWPGRDPVQGARGRHPGQYQEPHGSSSGD